MTWLHVFLVLLAGLATATVLAGPDKPSPASGEEAPFGTKIIAVVTRTGDKDGSPGGGYVEKVRLRRLGDRFFLVGTTPDFGEEFKANRGKVIWIAVSEVVHITEFDSVEELRRANSELERSRRDK